MAVRELIKEEPIWDEEENDGTQRPPLTGAYQEGAKYDFQDIKGNCSCCAPNNVTKAEKQTKVEVEQLNGTVTVNK